jgi:5'-3' exonuclease
MGVPKFFLHLLKNYKNTNFVFEKEKINNTKLLDEINNIDWFLIDSNCLFHPVAFKILAEEQKKENINFKSLQNKMYNAIIEYINKLIDYAKPKIGCYIAVDGPVGLCKMKQQRQRRYRSVNDKKLFDNIKKKHNKEIGYYWNNSAISPGTKFMEQLHNKIIEYCKNTKDIKIIYSSCYQNSEGEHKLLQFIRKNQLNNINYSYLTYGLDADLIFLMCSTGLNNIYLLREANQLDNKIKDDVLNYVSIEIMKDNIYNSFIKDTENKLNKERIIYDFVFIGNLLGNDFLPHLLAIDIGKKGIEFLIECYMSINENEYLVNADKKTINHDFFKRFINKIASSEEAIIAENLTKPQKKYCSSTEPYEKEMFRIENLMFKIDDPIGVGLSSYDDYRIKYYRHYFDVDDDELEEFVEKLVKQYLLGLRFTFTYYFDKICDYNWYYPYDVAPFIADINKYMVNINDFKFILHHPLLPFQQLMAILPSEANYLLPNVLSKVVRNDKSSISYLYPTGFDIDFLYKHKYYEGIPLLPQFDIDAIKHIYKKYKNDLTIDELKRNRIENEFYFN